ncbi:hypothetical protein BC829DRAFT_400244 [Chytridium lagenaria]|nr:hypothetical protein BC829DRAFT_400244 [Chytridium lagenaria]
MQRNIKKKHYPSIQNPPPHNHLITHSPQHTLPSLIQQRHAGCIHCTDTIQDGKSADSQKVYEQYV